MSTRKFPYAMETRVSGEICSLAQEEEAEISGWPLITVLTVTHIVNNGRHEKVILTSANFSYGIWFRSVRLETIDWRWSIHFWIFNIFHLFILSAFKEQRRTMRIVASLDRILEKGAAVYLIFENYIAHMKWWLNLLINWLTGNSSSFDNRLNMFHFDFLKLVMGTKMGPRF